MTAAQAPVDGADARRFAECALAAVRTPYPHELDHLILDAGDTPLPERIHPVFSGSYDWHSSVHHTAAGVCRCPRTRERRLSSLPLPPAAKGTYSEQVRVRHVAAQAATSG
jgi:Protein of unknown function (DUF2891)